MVRRSILAMFTVLAIVLGGVVVSPPAGAVVDTAVIVPSPNVGTNGNELYSVSCVSVSFCVATGFYNNGSAHQTLVEHWDGVSWTVVSSPNDGTTSLLRSVSCVSATECVAVGSTNTGNANQTLVVSLTGPELAPSDQVSPAFTG